MRHIERLPIPQILKEKKDVWQSKFEQKRAIDSSARPDPSKYRHKEILRQLNSCSYNKCFYCESKITGSPAEVDHYIEVAIHPGLAYEWENLYLACNSCNDKLNHNTIPVNDALNPCSDTDDEIQKHIVFEKECICSKVGSEKGLKTIKKFRLDSSVLDLKRTKWLNKLATKANEISNNKNVQQRLIYTQEEKDTICQFMQKDQPYSLMCETYIRKYLPWAIM